MADVEMKDASSSSQKKVVERSSEWRVHNPDLAIGRHGCPGNATERFYPTIQCMRDDPIIGRKHVSIG